MGPTLSSFFSLISYRICKLADSYPTEVERSVLNVSGRAPLEARHSEKDMGKTQGYRKWIYALKIMLDKLFSVGQFGLRNTRNLSNFWATSYAYVQTVLCPTCQWLSDNVLSHCHIFWTVLCQTVQWLVYAVSNCPMACEFGVLQFNGQTVLFPTVQCLDSPVSNFPTVG